MSVAHLLCIRSRLVVCRPRVSLVVDETRRCALARRATVDTATPCMQVPYPLYRMLISWIAPRIRGLHNKTGGRASSDEVSRLICPAMQHQADLEHDPLLDRYDAGLGQPSQPADQLCYIQERKQNESTVYDLPSIGFSMRQNSGEDHRVSRRFALLFFLLRTQTHSDALRCMLMCQYHYKIYCFLPTV
eukprot:SAG11_NODE_9983_length_865_cov_0.676240_1_plen_188_part_10